MTKYYVYLHKRSTDDSVFYVGKGTGNRAYKQHGRSKHWKNVVNKNGLTVHIYKDGLSEDDAFQLEKELIAYYGFQNLVNLTHGGEGTSGRVLSDEFYAKMLSFANSEQNKIRVSKQWKGVKRGKEFGEKLSKAKLGVKLSNAHVDSLRLAKASIMKQVLCIDNGMVFESVFYAEQWLKSIGKATKSAQAQIRHVCKNRCKTACGFKWKYKE